MRLTILAIGRLKDGAERELFARYAKRIDAFGRAQALGPLELREFSEARENSAAERRSAEARRLLDAVPQRAITVSLDETGRSINSANFADAFQHYRDAGFRDVAFLIGGPDGHGSEVAGRSDLVLSLSAMTLTHGLARVVLAEQIYRACSIIAGHPYHRA